MDRTADAERLMCMPWVLMLIPSILPSLEYGILGPLIAIGCVFLIAKGITVNLVVLVFIFHFLSNSLIFVISLSIFFANILLDLPGYVII